MVEFNKKRHLCFSVFWVAFLSFFQVNAQNVILGWDPSSNSSITRYNIYRSTNLNSTFTLLASTNHPQSSYLDNNLNWDTHYFYVATSVDKDGAESGFSNVIDTTLLSTVPVELYAFTARASKSNDVVLSWITMSESNNYGFEVQRRSSRTAENFQTIGFVRGGGTNARPQAYRFVDERVPAGHYYYRLKQTDLEGSYKFSNIVEIAVSVQFARLLQNNPNPFNYVTNITYYLPENSHVELIIYDLNGQEVRRLVDLYQVHGEYSASWDARDYLGNDVGSGTYYYKIKTESFTAFRKMTLLR